MCALLFNIINWTSNAVSVQGLGPLVGEFGPTSDFSSSEDAFFYLLLNPHRTLESLPISFVQARPVPVEARSECYAPPVSQNAPQQPPSLMKYGQWRTRWAQGESGDLMSQFLR
ncbi:hypothetical protein GOODEAATRI_007606 [Goodea atripinnis]|uniref:Uncharacterized protein n=1 Tax=Goodea atripinnis TaxID=208336 RepID=A0ABV0MQ68_9TELE